MLRLLSVDTYYRIHGELFHPTVELYETMPDSFVAAAKCHFEAVSAAWMKLFDDPVLSSQDEAIIRGKLDHIYLSSTSISPEDGAAKMRLWSEALASRRAT